MSLEQSLLTVMGIINLAGQLVEVRPDGYYKDGKRLAENIQDAEAILRERKKLNLA